MSNQSYTNQEVPYWLARPGVDAVSFIKQAAPPLAWLNRGIMYELNDGVLYYNGAPIVVGGGDPTFDSVTLTPIAANPGGPNTFWTHTPDGHLRHGAKDIENYDPTTLYASPDGLTLATGATGAINSPVSTITEALTLWTAAGATVCAVGDMTADAFTLPAQTLVCGPCGPSFRTLLGDVTAAGATWVPPPPFGSNQSFVKGSVVIGLIDYQATPMTTPLLGITDCVLIGGVTAVDGADCDARLLMQGCIVGSTVDVTNTQCDILDCAFGFAGAPGPIQITHDVAAAAPMSVVIQGITSSNPGTLDIAADSLTDVLTVSLIGLCEFTAINVNTVAALGGLVLVLDDVTAITWGPGTQANTTVRYVKDASEVGYSPAVPGDWAPPPTEVAGALDQLAAAAAIAGDVVGPAVAVDNRIATYDGVTGKLIKDSGIVARVGTGTRNTFITTQTVAADGANDNLVVGTGGSAGFGALTAFNCLICNETGNGAQITGNDNTCLGGRRPGYALTSSNSNTFLGSVSGWQVATGSGENTCVGYAAGSSLDATSARNTILGSQIEQGVAVNRNHCLLLGHNFQATADNQVRVANGSSAYTSFYAEGIYGSSLLTGDPSTDHLATAASSTRLGSSSILAMRNSYSLTVLDSGVTPVYNVLATDEYLLISAGGGVMTVNLPSAATKRAINMKKYSGLAVTITPTGGQTILGAATFVLVSGTAYTFLSDGGANWWVF